MLQFLRESSLGFALFLCLQRPLSPLACAADAPATPPVADFAFHDGDTVAFLGDSITAARGYTKIVEQYTLLRFPDRKVRFVHAGKGGDTASGCLARLDRDVFSRGATVVTVAFGINDIGWGAKADAAHRQAYLDGLRAIIERCQQHHVRPIICSAPITSEPPEKAEASVLQQMTDDGLALAKSLGIQTIDLQRGMREIQRRIVAANAGEKNPAKQTRLHLEDGIHLNELGHLAMAFTLLRGLGAPAEVSSAVLDATQSVPSSATAGCTLTEIKPRDGGLDFTRLDTGLPLTLGAFTQLNYRWMNFPDELNRYLLTIRNLPPGEYTIQAEGRPLGKTTAAQLARGLNISVMTADPWQPGGPWDVQSVIVKELVDARDKVTAAAEENGRLLSTLPENSALSQETQKLDDSVIALQRAYARPHPYHFEIRKITVSTDKSAPH